MKKKLGIGLFVVILISAFFVSSGECQKKNFLVYSALYEYVQTRLLAAFEEDTGLKGDYLRMSTGELVARVLAEKQNPRADVITGLSSETVDAIKGEGVIFPYPVPARKDIKPRFYDDKGYWHGFALGGLAIGVNTTRWKNKFGTKPYPAAWPDLLDPAFKGEIIMPSPLSSGTAYTFVATILQGMGIEKGWEYLTSLHNNVAQYTTSGAAPGRSVAAGEFTIAVNFGYDQVVTARGGYPLKIIYPPKTGPEIMIVSIINNGPNADAAKKYANWMLEKKAQQLYTDLTSQGPVRPGVLLPPEATPVEKMDFVNYDFKWAADNRTQIINEWGKRFR